MNNPLDKLFLLICILVIISCEIEDGISYIVGAGKRDCFYRVLKAGDMMDFDMQVLSGGDADITVTITAPSGFVAMHEHRQIEVTEEIQMNENGPYEICFDNTFSRFTDKTVYFDLGIDETNKTGLDHDELTRGLVLPKDEYEHREQIMKSLDSIGMKFETISHMQAVFRSRNSRHAYLQESNLKLVTWFSIGSCLVMVVVGILQVVLIRNLFENKSSKGMQSSL